jgi:hypothetical protein
MPTGDLLVRAYRKCGCTLVHKGDMRGVGLEYFEKLLPAVGQANARLD